jgi:hypothetical protein
MAGPPLVRPQQPDIQPGPNQRIRPALNANRRPASSAVAFESVPVAAPRRAGCGAGRWRTTGTQRRSASAIRFSFGRGLGHPTAPRPSSGQPRVATTGDRSGSAVPGHSSSRERAACHTRTGASAMRARAVVLVGFSGCLQETALTARTLSDGACDPAIRGTSRRPDPTRVMGHRQAVSWMRRSPSMCG